MEKTNSLLEIKNNLGVEQVVYRTLDFFSAASIIKDKKMMFTRADMFEDKNEGIERILSQLSIASPRSGCGMGWNNKATAKIAHQRLQRSHYVSCWSKNPESVAMWSLYSPDYSSIRISTKISKLVSVVNNFLNKYSITNYNSSHIGQQVIASVYGKLLPVRYISLTELSRKVQRRAEALAKIDRAYEKLGVMTPQFGKSNIALKRRLDQHDQLREAGSLKDISFKHEEEVRLIVKLGEEVFTNRMCEESPFADPKHEYHEAYKFTMECWGFVLSSELPEREFIDCPSDLIETASIDPRCPRHKAEFMKAWLNEHNIEVVKSSCFGYIPDELEIFPPQ